VPTPHRQTLAFALFEIAAADDRPAAVAGEYAPERLDLVVDLPEAKQTGDDRAKRGDLRREERRVPVFASTNTVSILKRFKMPVR
jgi:hypothetical protein